MDQLQFYPTSPTLAKRAWEKFRNRNWVRILEPSAGDGALAKEFPERQYSYGRHIPIDCYEIDISHHPTLRDLGFNVVGFDFTQIQSAAMYSHIVLNPPFRFGAEHTLLAWDKLLDGEIVAILNAETVRNPFSRERKRLVEMIDEFGEVEFIEGAFNTDETKVKTDVEIALIWLQKKMDVESIVGDVISTLRADLETGNGLARDFQQMNQVAHMNSTVENLVIAFNAAVKTMQESVFASAKASYYAGMLGDTMAVRRSAAESKYVAANISTVKEQIAERYIELKDRAWSQVLTSTDVTSKLSSKTAKELERQFETIKKMEFTASNIYGFLLGLVEKQGELQLDMALELFDLIGTYHSDNTVFYKGWKSNDKHRTCGMRLKTTRFVLPYMKGWSNDFDWDTLQKLRDIDKVFRMLDGKIGEGNPQDPFYGLLWGAQKNFQSLRGGMRIETEYFDFRWYQKAQTMHFYPKNKKLIDRLNRLVGRHRQWIPPEGERVSDAFWLQYEKAEKFDKELREDIKTKDTRSYGWGTLGAATRALMDTNRHDDGEGLRAIKSLDASLTCILEKHSISVNFQLEDKSEEEANSQDVLQLTLLAA